MDALIGGVLVAIFGILLIPQENVLLVVNNGPILLVFPMLVDVQVCHHI